jgi:hypothetical protein
MILRRAVRGLGEERPIEQLAGPELRAWILELRSTLSPISVAGYVRTLKVFGNWLAAEQLAQRDYPYRGNNASRHETESQGVAK